MHKGHVLGFEKKERLTSEINEPWITAKKKPQVAICNQSIDIVKPWPKTTDWKVWEKVLVVFPLKLQLFQCVVEFG